MDSTIKAVQSGYYDNDNFVRQHPPDMPSMLLKQRIVYLGLPFVTDVTTIIIAQLLYLQYDDPDKPIFIYINSTGTSSNDPGKVMGFETEAFAICDTINYIKPPVHTICIGQAMGTAAMILSSGTKDYRYSLPHATIVLHKAPWGARGQATDIQIEANEVIENKRAIVEILSRNTGQPIEKVDKDLDRMFYMTPYQAKEYGLIDKVLDSTRDLPAPVPTLI